MFEVGQNKNLLTHAVMPETYESHYLDGINASPEEMLEMKRFYELAGQHRAVALVEGIFNEIGDLATLEHMQRASEVGILIAMRLGMSEQDCVCLGMGLRIHDLGKSDPRLQQLVRLPRALDNDEIDEMDRHPDIGVDYARWMEVADEDIIIIIADHHMYGNRPYGADRSKLHGGRSILAKIANVADVHEALCSDRAYKSGMLPAQAATIIRSQVKVHDEVMGAYQSLIPAA